MKKTVLIALSIIFPLIILSQPCLPGGITFYSQVAIDNFQANNPDCTEILGNVSIQGADITNLDGLSVVTSIGGTLSIYGNDTLSNLSGLSNVTSIEGALTIMYNPGLTNLTGLGNVTSIGGILFVNDNDNLKSLTGLDNLTSIGGYIHIKSHSSLTSLAGIDNIDSASIDSLFIYDNPSLSICEVQSVCAYLASPNGKIEIHNNAIGCNSPQEVQDSCEAHAFINDKYLTIEDCSVSPNPFTTSTNISYTLDKPSTVTITIFNPQGQLIEKIEQEQPKGEQQAQWNAGGLPAGMYYFRMQAGEKVGGGKMVLME